MSASNSMTDAEMVFDPTAVEGIDQSTVQQVETSFPTIQWNGGKKGEQLLPGMAEFLKPKREDLHRRWDMAADREKRNRQSGRAGGADTRQTCSPERFRRSEIARILPARATTGQSRWRDSGRRRGRLRARPRRPQRPVVRRGMGLRGAAATIADRRIGVTLRRRGGESSFLLRIRSSRPFVN